MQPFRGAKAAVEGEHYGAISFVVCGSGKYRIKNRESRVMIRRSEQICIGCQIRSAKRIVIPGLTRDLDFAASSIDHSKNKQKEPISKNIVRQQSHS